jgi:hypothetical protein
MTAVLSDPRAARRVKFTLHNPLKQRVFQFMVLTRDGFAPQSNERTEDDTASQVSTYSGGESASR